MGIVVTFDTVAINDIRDIFVAFVIWFIGVDHLKLGQFTRHPIQNHQRSEYKIAPQHASNACQMTSFDVHAKIDE